MASKGTPSPSSPGSQGLQLAVVPGGGADPARLPRGAAHHLHVAGPLLRDGEAGDESLDGEAGGESGDGEARDGRTSIVGWQ